MTAAQLNIETLPGPDTIGRREFQNGVVGLSCENKSSPSVVVHGWLWTGAVDDPPGQAGLAGFTASMLTRGTERRTFAQIGEEIESLGATLGIGGSEHVTSFTAKCLDDDLDALLDILTDCLYHPTFPKEYVERRRGEILTAIEQREHNTQLMASLRFSEMMFPEHPYGHSRLGYKESIRQVTREGIERFYRSHHGPEAMEVVIVGAVDREYGLDRLEQAFGHWRGVRRTQPPLPPIAPIQEVRQDHVVIPGKTQSDIILGWVGMERKHPDFIKAYLANCILGQFGMMGRIGDNVRDRQGLAYYAYTSLDAGWAPGPWAAVIGVAPENAERAVEAVLDEIRRIQRESVDADELSDNKAYIVGSMPLRLEGKESVALRIAHMELYDLGLNYLRRLPGQIEALTPQDVMNVTQHYMDTSAYVLSIAGPRAKEEA